MSRPKVKNAELQKLIDSQPEDVAVFLDKKGGVVFVPKGTAIPPVLYAELVNPPPLV